jgi:hypothetical protein
VSAPLEAIFKHLQKVQEHKRVLVKAEVVNKVCSVMMDAANNCLDAEDNGLADFPISFEPLDA